MVPPCARGSTKEEDQGEPQEEDPAHETEESTELETGGRDVQIRANWRHRKDWERVRR